MKAFGFKAKLRYSPVLDKQFRPIVMDNREYRKAVKELGGVPVKIALERNDGLVSTVQTRVLKDGRRDDNIIYIERLIKTLLYLKGGWKVLFAGPKYIEDHLRKVYTTGGEREFDAEFMGRIYGKEFVIQTTSMDNMPETNDMSKALGRNLNGCRIGFDAGGSDRKVSAVIDGEAVYSEEVVWHPKLESDPNYHYRGIMESMKTAASKMPRVDAIGVSAAGVYISNRVKAASLFNKVGKDDFEKKVKNIFIDIAAEFGVPVEVSNDGDVTALAGAMSLNENRVLGIAMGTSEAAGYVDTNGNITGWLNELAFVPVDYNPDAMEDEWSHDIGCGVKYFSQDGVIKLAKNAGITLDESLSPAEKLKVIQGLMESGDVRAAKIYESIGCYLGYTLAYYAEFYDFRNVLILGRVTSGQGGTILLDTAEKVLVNEFPELDIRLVVPDEKSRRVGQSIAAASLPAVE
jgi:predicted NBD/HSP70 family sugar kinase